MTDQETIISLQRQIEQLKGKQLERIYTRCPSCQNDTLTINKGHLLCTWHECKDPVSIDQADRTIPTLMQVNDELRQERDQLKTQLAESSKLLKVARAGQPLGPVVGAMTIINQDNRIKELEINLAQMEARCEKLARETCVCGGLPLEEGGKFCLPCRIMSTPPSTFLCEALEPVREALRHLLEAVDYEGNEMPESVRNSWQLRRAKEALTLLTNLLEGKVTSEDA